MSEKSILSRACSEAINCRASNKDAGEPEGIVEGYFALWNQVDSHNTKFQRGCFSKSIKERAGKIVVRNSHGNPIGKPLDIREDEKGAWCSLQISLGVREGAETHTLVKDGVITGLSFGFVPLQDQIESTGVRSFSEVKLMEISPTWLPSGDDSRVTSVRSANQKTEERSTDFNNTVLEMTGHRLFYSLEETIYDIWWAWSSGGMDNAKAAETFDKALSDFHASYLEFVDKWFEMVATGVSTRSAVLPEVAAALSTSLQNSNTTLDNLVRNSKLTQEHTKLLCRGKHIADLDAASALPEEVRTINNQLRAKNVELMFTELRSCLTSAELRRSHSLLSLATREITPVATDSLNGRGNEILTKLNNL